MAQRHSQAHAEVKNIVIVSDTHIGCQLGLCPPEGMPKDGATTEMPSTLQRTVWEWWLEFWEEWVPRVTRGEPYSIVFNGDAIDGRHHGSTHQMSHNLNDQAALAETVLAPLVRKAEGGFYFVRGTEAHVGPSAEAEEGIARRIGAIPNEDGKFSRWELWKRLGPHLIHFLHHIGSTGSSAYEATAVHKEMTESFVEAGRWGDQPPQVVVRSHRHRCLEVRIPTAAGYGIAIVTPAWQLKTPFTWKIPGARLSQPQIGGVLIRLGDEELHSRFFVKRIERTRPE